MRKTAIALLLVLAFSSVFVICEPCDGVTPPVASSTSDNISTLISQTATQPAELTLFQDNFDDNQFDETFWEKIQVDGGTVEEKNGRLQVTIPSHAYDLTEAGYWGNYSQAGYMTKRAFDTHALYVDGQGFEASVNVVELDNVMEVSLMISDQKITNLDPINASNWYRVLKIKDTHYPDRQLVMVESRVDGGAVSVRMEGPWLSAMGQLKIKVSGDEIAFYENGVLRYVEPYSLASESCYVSVFTSSLGCFFGTDSFDDFAVYPTNIYGANAIISISAESVSATAGSAVNVFGTLTDSGNKPLQNKTVVLSYTFSGANSWISISSGLTDEQGNYIIQWINSASGTFRLKTEWRGEPSSIGVSNTTTLSFLPYQNKQVFLFESNSTVHDLAFNNQTSTLSFNVTGPSGTTGYVIATISKALLANGENLQVYMDGNQLNYSVVSTLNSWVITFNYSHSTHQISILLKSNVSSTQPIGNIAILIVIIALFCAILAVVIKVGFDRKETVTLENPNTLTYC
jgi:hypothetical protein